MQGKGNMVAVIGGSFLTLIIYKILNSNGVFLGFLPAIVVWFGCYWFIKTVANKLTNK